MTLTNCSLLMYSISLSTFSPRLFESSTSYILKHMSWQQTVEKNQKHRTFLIFKYYDAFFFFTTGLFILYFKRRNRNTIQKTWIIQCSWL